MKPAALVLLALDGRPIVCPDSDVRDAIAVLTEARWLLPNDDLGSVPLWRDNFDKAISDLSARVDIV